MKNCSVINDALVFCAQGHGQISNRKRLTALIIIEGGHGVGGGGVGGKGSGEGGYILSSRARGRSGKTLCLVCVQVVFRWSLVASYKCTVLLLLLNQGFSSFSHFGPYIWILSLMISGIAQLFSHSSKP